MAKVDAAVGTPTAAYESGHAALAVIAGTNWDELTAIGTFSLAAVTALLVIGVLFAWRQLRATRVATQLEANVDLLREYRSTTMRLQRAQLRQLPECDPNQGLEQLSADDREALENVFHYLDQVGMLVSVGMLEIDSIARFLGGSAQAMWRCAAPFIYADREVHARPTYQRHLEYLSARLDREMPATEDAILALDANPPPDAQSGHSSAPPGRNPPPVL